MAVGNGEDLKAYVARPRREGPGPALILVHEIWGINENIREFARDFAAKGYFTLAVDLYEGRTTQEPEEAYAWAEQANSDPANTLQNIHQAIDYLKNRPEVDQSRIGIVGWAFGADWTFRAAFTFEDLKAAISYYGKTGAENDFSTLKAPILGHYGEEDRTIAANNAQALQARLEEVSPDHEVYLYPFAGHAFARKGGSKYNPPASQLAWHRTLAFLEKHLG